MVLDWSRGETLKVRLVTHVVSVHSLDVGDLEGHTASLACFSGLALYPDGAVGPVRLVSLADYIGGAGTFTLYPALTYADGSELWLKSVGKGTLDGTTTHFVGTLTVVGGKGRFGDAKGAGTFTGTRYRSLSVGVDLISDYTINLT